MFTSDIHESYKYYHRYIQSFIENNSKLVKNKSYYYSSLEINLYLESIHQVKHPVSDCIVSYQLIEKHYRLISITAFKNKNPDKINSFIDKYINRHKRIKPNTKKYKIWVK